MKLQIKVFILFVSIGFLIGGPLLWTIRQSARKIDLDEVAQKGQIKALDLADRTAAYFPAAQETSLLPFLQAAQEETGALYVAAIGLDGRVLAHTNVAEKGRIYKDADTQTDLHLSKPHSHTAFYRDSFVMDVSAPVWSHSAASSAEDFLLSGEKEPSQKERLGLVRLGLPLDQLLQREMRLFLRIVAIIGVAGGMGILLLFFFIHRMLRPVHWLSAGTARIAQGEYGVAVPVRSKDELGDLAADFNRMSNTLAETTVSKDYMSSILNNLVDPLIVMGLDTTLRIVNPALCQLLDYGEKELVGKPVDILFAKKERPFQETEVGLRIRGGAVRNLELEFAPRRGEAIPILYSSSLLRDSNQRVTGIIAVAKDMTERKKLEKQILQTGKLSAVGQLAGGVAHEINNPLGVILGFSQGVLRRVPAGDPLEMPLKSIEREAMRCKNLVQDLLTFSRAAKVEREPMDLNRAIEGALSLVTAQARIGQVTVKKEFAQDLPRILGNPNQVQQIIVNLANNSLDAMGKQGTLTIRTTLLKESHRSWICIFVSDTGSGIPPEVMPKIFEPFFTTKPVGQGTGLGLGLVHEIIQKHSGTIDVQSRPGFTEFCLKFPVRDASVPLSQSPGG